MAGDTNREKSKAYSSYNIDSCNDEIAEMFYGAKDEVLFKYPQNELPMIALYSDVVDGGVYLVIDTAITFNTEENAKECIKESLHSFAQWMVNNDYDISSRLIFNELFRNGVTFKRKYETIEEAYAAYKVLALGFIYGLSNASEQEADANELLDLVDFGYDPKAKVWVAEGQPPIEFTLEHENIVTLAERVWRILPEIKEMNAENIKNGPDTLSKWLNSSDHETGYGLFCKDTWESKELFHILHKYEEQMHEDAIKRMGAVDNDVSHDDYRRKYALYDQLTIVERLEDAHNKSDFEMVVAAIKKEIERKIVQPNL